MEQPEPMHKPSSPPTNVPRSRLVDAFTLIEILVVMAVIALLLTLALPRYFHSIDRAKEAVLKQDLAQMRDAIDKYYGDRNRYPDSLQDLVTRQYLRNLPVDPITETQTSWTIITPPESGNGAVFDVKSGAPGIALDGSKFIDW